MDYSQQVLGMDEDMVGRDHSKSWSWVRAPQDAPGTAGLPRQEKLVFFLNVCYRIVAERVCLTVYEKV